MPQVMCEKIAASIPPLLKVPFGGYSLTSPLYKKDVQFTYNRTMKKSRKNKELQRKLTWAAFTCS